MNISGNLASRQGYGDNPVCFLDFDGVLHPDEAYYSPSRGIYMRAAGHSLFEWANILAELLSPYPAIRIVLSTSWVPMRSYMFARSHLPEKLQLRVIGATYHSRELSRKEFNLLSRGEQVCRYVVRRNIRRWCAIDDDVEGWPSWSKSRLIQTDGSTGLNNEEVKVRISRAFAAL